MADEITLVQASRKHVPGSEHGMDVQDGRRDDENKSLDTHGIQNTSTSLIANSSLNGRGNASIRASHMLSAQRTHGNRAVQRVLQHSVGPQVSVQREADEEEIAKSVLGDAAVKAADSAETDTMNDKEYAARMSGSTVEEPKSPGEGVVTPDKSNSEAEEQARAEREKQDDKEIYERELRRAGQERMRDQSIPLNNTEEENLRGRVRDGAFTPLGGQRRLNPFGL